MVTSTSEVYGTAQYVPIDEHHPFQGQSPYSATKIGADRLAESFYRSFDLPVSIVRPFNTYGPRQSGRAIIPTIITQLLAGQQEIKLGSLTPTRDFNYVKDTAHGFMAIADCDAAIGPVSYTHLDVYKRQFVNNAVWWLPRELPSARAAAVRCPPPKQKPAARAIPSMWTRIWFNTGMMKTRMNFR